MRMRGLGGWLRCLLAVLCLALGKPGLAGPESGLPIIRNFPPKAYGAEAQNWAVVQDPKGLVYVANNLGVLEFDGARWRLTPTPSGGTVRSLAVDAEGRVWVGGDGEIGRLDTASFRETRFESFKERLPEAQRRFSDVWVAARTPRGMLFQSREQLMLWDGRGFRTWKAETTFHKAFAVGNRILVRQRSVGLMELVGDELKLVPEGARFAEESVFAILPDPKGDLVVVGRKSGLHRLTAQGLTHLRSEAEAYLVGKSVYHGLCLGDGSFAFATLLGGVLFTDPEGRILGILDERAGLLGDNIKALGTDRQGGIWLVLDNGIARVEWPSPWSTFDARLGLKGAVWALHRHGGRLLAATGQGLLELVPSSPGREGMGWNFNVIPGSLEQCLDFCSVGDSLLVATSRGVHEVIGQRLRPVWPSSQAAIALQVDRRRQGRVFVGFQGGLAVLDRQAGEWRFTGTVPGVKEDIYSIAQEPSGALWLGTVAAGIRRVLISPDWPAGPPPEVQGFGLAEGLPSEAGNRVAKLRSQVVVGTRNGFYRFKDGRMQPDPDLRIPGPPREIRALSEDPTGRIWVVAGLAGGPGRELGVLESTGRGWAWRSSPYERFGDLSWECVLAESDGSVWFGGSDGLVRCSPPGAAPRDLPFTTLLRGVESRVGGRLSAFGPGAVLPYRDHSLSFEFGAPSFDRDEALRYQVWLEGWDPGWSDWVPSRGRPIPTFPKGRTGSGSGPRMPMGASAKRPCWASASVLPGSGPGGPWASMGSRGFPSCSRPTVGEPGGSGSATRNSNPASGWPPRNSGNSISRRTGSSASWPTT